MWDPDGRQHYHIITEGIPNAVALVRETQNYTQDHSKNFCV